MAEILVTVPFAEEERAALLKEAEHFGDRMLFVPGKELTGGLLSTAAAVIGNIAPEMLKEAKELQWLQLNSAGADDYLKKGVLPESVKLTCATGSYGTTVSEYMCTMLLVMMKKIPQYLEDQKARRWADEGSVSSPAGKRILIAGTGDIGLSFERKIRGFSLPDYPITISGVRRRAEQCPAELDEIHPLTELAGEVEKADVIAAALPGTPSTYHVFDAEMLKRCKRGAYFMNVGRGSAVDDAALLEPAVWQNFSGIWMDVFEKEPLTPDDPLYSVPNLLITPHIAGKFHLDITLKRIAALSLKNYRAWKENGTFTSEVNRETGYAE